MVLHPTTTSKIHKDLKKEKENMQSETYVLLHRMVCAAQTQSEMEIVLRRFQEIIEATSNSTYGQDLFDGAWALACSAGLYSRLGEPQLAEQAYQEAIELFDTNDMTFNASAIRLALARFLAQRGRYDDAEDTLRQSLISLVRVWGVEDHRVFSAEEELRHFQLTGEVIEAYRHGMCQACGIGDHGADFGQEGRDKAER